MMAVTARFYVRKVTEERQAGSTDKVGHVELSASIKGDENKSWAKYTPAGNIMLSTVNPGALEWFAGRIGKDVAITFDDAGPVTT
jgi:hypothetical protein